MASNWNDLSDAQQYVLTEAYDAMPLVAALTPYGVSDVHHVPSEELLRLIPMAAQAVEQLHRV